jgi:hypothetical protein
MNGSDSWHTTDHAIPRAISCSSARPIEHRTQRRHERAARQRDPQRLSGRAVRKGELRRRAIQPLDDRVELGLEPRKILVAGDVGRAIREKMPQRALNRLRKAERKPVVRRNDALDRYRANVRFVAAEVVERRE